MTLYDLWRAYRLRWKRRYFIARALRRRRQLSAVSNKSALITPGSILCFACVRNEAERIGYFLQYHRDLGIGHFLIVDNASNDGTREYLLDQPDVSLWHTDHSYKASRFGMDWVTWLQFRYGHGHWCLTLDADELILIPHQSSAKLQDLSRWLESQGAAAIAATMIDLYPKGPLDACTFEPDDDPLSHLMWLDAGGIEHIPRTELKGTLKRGGVRGRMFFADAPERAPTLSKLPFVKWSRRFAYLTSTHVILPPRLNDAKMSGEVSLPEAAILHTKFLPTIVQKSREEKLRKQHFSNSSQYDAYYESLAKAPDFWTENSVKFQDWKQLEDLGLLTRGDWNG